MALESYAIACVDGHACNAHQANSFASLIAEGTDLLLAIAAIAALYPHVNRLMWVGCHVWCGLDQDYGSSRRLLPPLTTCMLAVATFTFIFPP
jgi:hypothetical protein